MFCSLCFSLYLCIMLYYWCCPASRFPSLPCPDPDNHKGPHRLQSSRQSSNPLNGDLIWT